jgi:hypothetical protein
VMHRPEDRTGNICLHGRVGPENQRRDKTVRCVRTYTYESLRDPTCMHHALHAKRASATDQAAAQRRDTSGSGPPSTYDRAAISDQSGSHASTTIGEGKLPVSKYVGVVLRTQASGVFLSFSVTAAGPAAAPQRAPAPGCRGRPACGPRWRPLGQHTHLLRDPHACIVIIVVLTTLTESPARRALAY